VKIESVNTSAFVGTNQKDEPITSGLPVTWPEIVAHKFLRIVLQ
jgi:hypothetical protein